jgi:recombination protein RecA
MAETKEDKKEEKKTKLEETRERLDKKYGEGSLVSLGSKFVQVDNVYSSGSIGMDYIALGIGGYAKGKLYEIMGWEGTGKSTLCGHIVASCQRAGDTAAYIDGEHAVDKSYFQKLGVDVNKMLIAQPSTGEEGFQIALDLINTGEVGLIIIDSDSSLIPKKVIEGDIGESAIGKKALLNNLSYPKLKSALSTNNVCVVVISQFREKIGVMFGDPRTTQGGHALKFYTDVRMEINKSLVKEGEEVYGHKATIKVVKNKMAPPFRKVDFEIVFGKGIDRDAEIVKLADEFGVINIYGKKVTFKDVKYEFSDKDVAKKEFIEMINSKTEIKEEITNLIIQKLKSNEINS